MNENTFRRANLIYSATPLQTSGIADLVTGMGELTVEDIWVETVSLLSVTRWATNRQIQLWVRNFSTDRYTTLEKLLKRKVRSGDLRVDHYGKPKVYARPIKTRGVPKKYRPYLYHEISCTECYIRFQKSKKGTGIPSGDFKSLGVIPDFAVKHEIGVIAVEFESEGDTQYHKRLEGKVEAYIRNMWKIEEEIKLPPIVVFILDIDREEVKRKVKELHPEKQMYFCDYQTLKQTDLRDALTSPIWIWKDGTEYKLTA